MGAELVAPSGGATGKISRPYLEPHNVNGIRLSRSGDACLDREPVVASTKKRPGGMFSARASKVF
jgi:hypothetical protein